MQSQNYHEQPEGAKDMDNDGGGGGDEDDRDAKENFWDTAETAALREDTVSKKSLSVLWEGTQRREQAQRSLEQVLEESKLGMEAILHQGIVAVVVEPFMQEWTTTFEQLDTQLVQSFETNTQRRWDMQQRLDKHQEQWQRQYRRLTGQIQDRKEDEVDNANEIEDVGKVALNGKVKERCGGNESSDDGADNDGTQKTQPDESPSKNSQNSSSGGEPDWESLLNQDHSPTAERVRRFLETRERLQTAEDQFRAAMDDIHNKFISTTDDLLQIAIDVHNPLDDALGSEESELQYYLVRNYQRRQDLARAVEESAKQAQGVFARLMARVKTLGCAKKRKRNEDENAE